MFVGRVSEEKGADLFCQAVSELKKQYNIEGIVVGDGDCLIKLKEQYPDIQFVGWKSSKEVAIYMQSARAIVIPSRWYEAAPLLLLEAYSASLPSIVSSCCAATEIIKDGENGLIFQAYDTESLKEKIICSLDDDYLIKIQNQIKKEYNPELYRTSTHASKLIDVYNDLLYS